MLACALGGNLALTRAVRAADLDTPSPEPPAPAAPAAPAASDHSWLDVSTWPFIPVPLIAVDLIAVDPDSGVTLGVLPTWPAHQ